MAAFARVADAIDAGQGFRIVQFARKLVGGLLEARRRAEARNVQCHDRLTGVGGWGSWRAARGSGITPDRRAVERSAHQRKGKREAVALIPADRQETCLVRVLWIGNRAALRINKP